MSEYEKLLNKKKLSKRERVKLSTLQRERNESAARHQLSVSVKHLRELQLECIRIQDEIRRWTDFVFHAETVLGEKGAKR